MTLLSIVGDDISRIIPVLYAYKDQIKHHVLFCDDDPLNHERAKTLQKGMQRFSSKHSLGWYTKIIATNEDSAEDIKEAAKDQFNFEGELWLNATDGYPAITILLSDLVRKEGGKVLSYDHFDNDLHIIESDGSMETKPLFAKMDLDAYMTLLNYKIEKKTKNDLLPRKKYIMNLYKDEKRFVKVRKALLDLYHGNIYGYDFSGFPDVMENLRALDVIDQDNNISTENKQMIEGDLLEEYLFWLCETLNFDDIALSAEIDFDDENKEASNYKRVINEFDILMIHNNRIYTVECKFKNNLSGVDIVYKYDAIIDYFGHTSKAIIANISNKYKNDYIGMKQSDNFTHSSLRRARMSGISVYHESQVDVVKFQNLVQNFFHLRR